MVNSNPLTLNCKECKSSFTITTEDFYFLDKFQVPPPKCCPECRQQRRLAIVNEMNLYHRTCDFSGETIISHFSSDKPYKVYNCPFWWSKDWDACEYGRNYNFNKPFFEQFDSLLTDVPHVSLLTSYTLNENCEFTNYVGRCKDCYLIFHADNNRDCYYGYGIKSCKNSMDCYNLFDSELCYQCIDCKNCYNLKFSQNCISCSDSLLLDDCIACKNCIGCKNLHQKQYYIFNKPYSKKDYEIFCQEHKFSSRKEIDKLQESFEQLCQTLPYRNLRMIKTEDSIGDHLIECKNVSFSFDVNNLRDGRYCSQVHNGARDCLDMYQFGLNAELIYECSIVGGNAHLLKFCCGCDEQISNLTYTQESFHSSNLFGCFGLKHKQYCILNKQYTKHQYEELIPKIIAHMTETGEWGEFFPIANSPYAYNESNAQLYYPLTKEQCLAKGYKWKDEEVEIKKQEILPEVPDNIQETTEEISKQVFLCIESHKPYKIIPQEFAFYKKNNIPLPSRCFNQRHKDRLAKRNPRKITSAKCSKCQKEILSSQEVKTNKIIYCEKCFENCLE